MTKQWADLSTILRAGDTPAVHAFFAGMKEKEREAFVPHVRQWLVDLAEDRRRDLEAHRWGDSNFEARIHRFQKLFRAAYVASSACDQSQNQGSALAYLGLDDDLVSALKDRADFPKQAYCESLISQEFGWSAPAWRAVRAMVRKGLCRAPDHDNYVLGALVGLNEIISIYEDMGRRAEGLPPLPVSTLKNRLLGERDWLDTAFWRLFEIDGLPNLSLANIDRRGGKGAWTSALVDLSREGVLSRERLLDASLAALGRGFPQFRAGWFSRFHEAMEPTIAERHERVDTYLGLLGSDVPPTVSFALEAIAQIDAEHPLSARILLAALEPALRSRTKKLAHKAVDFLERLAEREPDQRRHVCIAATEAWLGEHVDVQSKTLQLLERHGRSDDKELLDRIAMSSPALRASLRPRLEAWLQGAQVAPVRVSMTAPADVPSQRLLSPLDPSRALTPIATLDDLFDRASAVLESPQDIDEVECILEGIARLGGEPSEAFERLAKPLAKRAVARLRRPGSRLAYASTVEEVVAYTLVSWLARKNYLEDFCASRSRFSTHEPIGFLLRRVSAVASQFIGAASLPPLSAPTHQGGWIAPQTLVERWLVWQKAGLEPDRYEQVLSLLRLAREERSSALKEARKLRGEAGRVVRHALGEPTPPGDDAALWLAAYRSDAPYADLPEFEQRHPRLGPGGGQAARCSYAPPHLSIEPEMPGEVDPALLPVLVHRSVPRPSWDWNSRPLLRWVASLWPAERESFFLRGIPALEFGAGWSDAADREAVGFLEPLCDPFTEMRPLACHALALGLGAKEASMRAQAREGLIAAIAEGRLPLDTFGQALAIHFADDPRKRIRWAKVFLEVSQYSSAHSTFLAQVLPLALPAQPGSNPRNVGPYLEALNEVLSAANARIESASARAYLAGLTGSGRIPALAKKLLAR